jgi:hypothetical protein
VVRLYALELSLSVDSTISMNPHPDLCGVVRVDPGDEDDTSASADERAMVLRGSAYQEAYRCGGCGTCQVLPSSPDILDGQLQFICCTDHGEEARLLERQSGLLRFRFLWQRSAPS